MFYENGMLCEYLRENLNVETIHDRIDKLKYIAKRSIMIRTLREFPSEAFPALPNIQIDAG